MYEISWKPEYTICHSVIDNEHKKLFEIAAKAFEPVIPELRKDKITKIINSLKEYMKVHFSHEESFMRVIEYPNFENHKSIHQTIIEDLNKLIATIETFSMKEFELELAYFVENALIGHILNEDKKIHEWYEDKQGQKHIIKWKDSYLIENEEIDKEHQALFDIANEAFLEGESGSPKQKIKDVVHKLFSYISTHFKHEEAYMKEIKYPDYKLHCQKHEKIIEEINAFMKQMPTMNAQTFELELAISIEKWLVQHIVNEDKKIKPPQEAEIVKIVELSEL